MKSVNKQSNQSNKSSQRIYLLAVTVQCGIIQLINADGTIGYYRQRGIQRLTDKEKKMFIQLGFLHPNWEMYRELPSNISIYYEDEYIQGKARATFPSASTLFKEIQKMTGTATKSKVATSTKKK